MRLASSRLEPFSTSLVRHGPSDDVGQEERGAQVGATFADVDVRGDKKKLVLEVI